MSSKSLQPVDLKSLIPVMQGEKGFPDVLAALNSGQSATISGAWGSSYALAGATIAENAPGPILFILPRIHDLDDFALDLSQFLENPPEVFPAWETLPDEHHVADIVFGSRLRILKALESPNPPRVIITSIPALVQPVPSRRKRDQGSRRIHQGEEINPDELIRWLVDRGFERVPAVELPGEISMRGGIIDIFSPGGVEPYRIELFGDEIDSIRSFDVETQRKTEDLDSIDLSVISPPDQKKISSGDSSQVENLIDSLPENSWIVLSEFQDLIQEGRQYLMRMDEPRGLFSVDSVMERCIRFPNVSISAISADGYDTSCHLKIESIERFTGPRSTVLEELDESVKLDSNILICCHNEGEKERLSELLQEYSVDLKNKITLCLGHLTKGFRIVPQKLVVLSDNQLFGRVDLARNVVSRKKRVETRAIDNFLDLKAGDIVVHVSHGIGKFLGMKILDKDGQFEENLIVEFKNQLRVYVPTSLIHLVQKYVGATGKSVPLSKLGGSAWAKKKEKVAEAVSDMASDMLRLQAMRASKEGIAFPVDSHWQAEFDASFPFVETPDQNNAIEDVKTDMQNSQPMDRLICGDVGYGKTEIAMRAAFKAIDSGRQVAVLVPTTVLAEQHYRTFSERMAEFPISIDVLSRFRSKKEQKQILNKMEEGTVDLVVGTHRIVQKDVRFKDLGLLIIDEEQRFGVEAKDALKRLRMEIDVVTLSATPIPRTLHMSLLGIRDISNLMTAPQERQPIETHINRFDAELIRHASIRELNRNGQIYFVHNRVHNIKSMADRIQQIVPEAKIGIGHGQMKEGELEEVMYDFVTGNIDILVCTTIIESGLDIPNANTIFIHQGDQFGLADLHQLRGRVGRYKHRAYCYLLIEEGKVLTSTGAKRLKAIEEFSELGAGFKISMRDLEIRGAGNILGTEQSGHISAVGYELYCQLLENAVRSLKNLPKQEPVHVFVDLPVSAYIPDSYISNNRHKIEMYRKISLVKKFEEIESIQEELRDRFGPLPDEVEQLLILREIQLLSWFWGIEEIRIEDGYFLFQYKDSQQIERLKHIIGKDLRIADYKTAYLVLPHLAELEKSLFSHLKEVLQLNG